MKPHFWLLALLLALPSLGSGQSEGEWERSLRAAGKIHPDLADPQSALSLRTAALRTQWSTSNDFYKREAVRIHAALVIAEAAKAEIDAANTAREQERADQAAVAERNASEKAVLAKYPDATDPNSALTSAANKIIKEWTAIEDPRIYEANAPMLVYDLAHATVTAEAARAAEKARRDKEAASAEQERQRFDQQRQQYEQAALAKYPAAANPRTLFYHNAERLRQQWLAAEDARLRQVNAPMLLYDAANAQTEAEIREAQAQLAALEVAEVPRPTNRAPTRPKSRFVTVIQTAQGHWQTSEGTTIIQTATGHWTTTSGRQIIEIAPGHFQIMED